MHLLESWLLLTGHCPIEINGNMSRPAKRVMSTVVGCAHLANLPVRSWAILLNEEIIYKSKTV